MRYDLRLQLSYLYEGSVNDARHVLRVRPRQDRGQRVEHSELRIEPAPGEAAAETDFFGNPLDHLLIEKRHETLRIVMEARVEVHRPAPEASRSAALRDLAGLAAASRETGGDAPTHFLGASRLVRPSDAVGAYVGTILSAHDKALDAVRALTDAIRADFRYEAGSTRIGTDPDAVLAERRGVCQDFAHLAIAGLRRHGIPAAYVSGFIRTDPPPGMPRLSGVDAMHAWIEAWLGPEAGWVGFDPTNGCLALDDHIAVAVGRDYADVAPIDGVLLLSGGQRAAHAVDVVPIEDQG